MDKMKTTENISLAGYAFTIETDACQELETYLNDIREAFASDASAEEITADIEARVAELLKEKYVSGMVVDIAMVKEIKERIGDPKMLAQEDPDTAANPGPAVETPRTQKENEKKQHHNYWKSKRLFRNIDERILGGVCSGLGSYFGIDKVLFRIIFLVLFFIGFVGIEDGPFILISVAAYLCLWIAMPAARTAEQKREMKGKPMNLKSYKQKDFDFEKEVKDVAQSPAGQTTKRAGGVFLGIILLIVGLCGLLGSIIIPAMPNLMGTMLAEFTPFDPSEQVLVDIITFKTFWHLIFVLCCIMFVWFIYNGVMLLFDLKYPSWRPGMVLFIAWLISIFAIFAWFIKTAAFDFPTLLMHMINL